MKKIAAIIMMLLASCTSNPKTANVITTMPKEELMFPYGDTTFNWNGIEKTDDNLREKLAKQISPFLKSQHEFYTYLNYTEKDFEKQCHVLDINKDGLDDVIYTGSTGSEGKEVDVFLNTKNGFKKIFRQVQTIVKLQFQDGLLFRMFINDNGCCDAYVDFNWIYQIDFNSKKPRFEAIYLTSNLNSFNFPKKFLSQPIHFEVLNNKYKMRREPVIDDTTKNGVGGIFFKGNNIDTLDKGTTGRAIATQKDKTGRVWWLVEIDGPEKNYGALFYEPEPDSTHKQLASKIGWISSRYVKVLDR